MEFDSIDLSKCMPNKDFGCGFYTTLLEEQAWRMAERRTRIAGGIPVVMVYEVPDDLVDKRDLNCRVFEDKPTIEWALFIRNNRDRNFPDYKSPECNLDCKYDVVVGPVANDTVGLLIRQFSRGTIDAEYLKKEFDFGRLTNQYTFHTENALKYLKKVGVMRDKPATGND
jgi:hypothetical protein